MNDFVIFRIRKRTFTETENFLGETSTNFRRAGSTHLCTHTRTPTHTLITHTLFHIRTSTCPTNICLPPYSFRVHLEELLPTLLGRPPKAAHPKLLTQILVYECVYECVHVWVCACVCACVSECVSCVCLCNTSPTSKIGSIFTSAERKPPVRNAPWGMRTDSMLLFTSQVLSFESQFTIC